MTDAKSTLEKFLSAYSQMSRADQREFANEFFEKCGETPEQIRDKVVEACERNGKSIRDIGIELACSKELSELEISEALDLVVELDELAGQATKFTQ